MEPYIAQLEDMIRKLNDYDMSMISGLEQHPAQINDLPNVVDFGVGYQRIAGRQTGKIGPIVYVSRKYPTSALPPAGMIPGTIEVRGVNYRVDVMEMPQLNPLCEQGDPSAQIQEHRPLVGGNTDSRCRPKHGQNDRRGLWYLRSSR